MEAALERIRALVLSSAVGVYAGASSAQDAFDNVISDQLTAFQDRDIARAFTFASPAIKRIFGGPENFGIMVERSFPMIWDNASARFLAQRQEGGAIFQRVIVTGKDGRAFVFDYKMLETPQGWQIDGVDYVPPPDLSA